MRGAYIPSPSLALCLACALVIACLLDLSLLSRHPRGGRRPSPVLIPPPSLRIHSERGGAGMGQEGARRGITPSLPPPFALVSSARLTSHTIPDLNMEKTKTRHTVSFVLGGAASGDRPPATPQWGSAPQPTAAAAAAAATLSNNFFSHFFHHRPCQLAPFTLGPSIPHDPPPPLHTHQGERVDGEAGWGAIWTGRSASAA